MHRHSGTSDGGSSESKEEEDGNGEKGGIDININIHQGKKGKHKEEGGGDSGEKTEEPPGLIDRGKRNKKNKLLGSGDLKYSHGHHHLLGRKGSGDDDGGSGNADLLVADRERERLHFASSVTVHVSCSVSFFSFFARALLEFRSNYFI